jgi:hypothetical protein
VVLAAAEKDLQTVAVVLVPVDLVLVTLPQPLHLKVITVAQVPKASTLTAVAVVAVLEQ